MLRCKECHNINIIRTANLLKDTPFNFVKMNREIKRNTRLIPKITTNAVLVDERAGISSMNRAVPTKISTCQQ
jgi:hypothetical protein